MNYDGLPPELAELENRLAGRFSAVVSPELRDRILRATEQASGASAPQGLSGWHWASVAAAVLLVLNLSMISASQSEFSVRPAAMQNSLAAEMQALQTIEQEGNRK